jgi:hypothetical protein
MTLLGISGDATTGHWMKGREKGNKQVETAGQAFFFCQRVLGCKQWLVGWLLILGE